MAEEQGLSSPPYFAEALYSSFIRAGKNENEFMQVLSDILVGIYNLHNQRIYTKSYFLLGRN